MNDFRETQRQIRIALAAIGIVIVVGIGGFALIEGLTLLDAAWLTIITLSTIGYGDIVAKSVGGRLFTLFIILTGLSMFAYGIQGVVTLAFSNEFRALRQRRRDQRVIDELADHTIICGRGELIDKTIEHLLREGIERHEYQKRREKSGRSRLSNIITLPVEGGRRLAMARRRHLSIPLSVVVVTPEANYASQLRERGLLVLEGDPSADSTLERAGVRRARGMIVILDDDTQALLTTLTAHSQNADLYITAAALREDLVEKTMRVGANTVITPYTVAGLFLNNATLRPAVNHFFSTVLLNRHEGREAIVLPIRDGSPWIGRTLAEIESLAKTKTHVIARGRASGGYDASPGGETRLQLGDALIVVTPHDHIIDLEHQSTPASPATVPPSPPSTPTQTGNAPPAERTLSREQAIEEAAKMKDHFVICGFERAARSAIDRLNPLRPFVIISDDESYTHYLLEHGFIVIHGSPTSEFVLRRAGVDRALSIMVGIEDAADSVLTVLSARSLSQRVLITVTSVSDPMDDKLKRAGADRVINPFRIAAQYVLMTALRPTVSDFMQSVLFNYATQTETTELYLQDNSPWIDQTIENLALEERYQASILAIRHEDGAYRLAPPPNARLRPHDVLIVVTSMKTSDRLRDDAHGGRSKRPVTLRHVSQTHEIPAAQPT